MNCDENRNHECISIGDFILSRIKGGYWLQHKDGEGMQILASDLLGIINELWKHF